MAPSDAVQLAGAATDASAHDIPLADAPNIRAAEIAATASRSLGVSAATTVKTTMPSSPMMTGILRLLMGVNPRRMSQSAIQPPPMLPTTPNANGIAATMPVFGMDMWRCISRYPGSQARYSQPM